MDRQLRNLAKERQIQMAEEWQAALDKVRVDINKAREAYRQTLIVEVFIFFLLSLTTLSKV